MARTRLCIRPALESLGVRALPSSAPGFPADYAATMEAARQAAEYRAFVDSSAADYELEMGAYYDRARQFPMSPPFDAAKSADPATATRLLLEELYRAMERALRGD